MGFSVGLSSYGDLKGVEQFVATQDIADQVSSLCYEFDTQVARNGDRLTVNEGIRSIERQILLYNQYLHHGGALAAYVYPGPPPKGTSTHDPSRGSALDFGITDKNGNNRALTDAEFSWLHANCGRRGIRWTGAAFSRVEPWHHNGGYAATLPPITNVRRPGTPIPATPAKDAGTMSEETMSFIVQHDSKGRGTLLVGPKGVKNLNAEQLAIITGLKRKDGNPEVPLYALTSQGNAGARRYDVIKALYK